MLGFLALLDQGGQFEPGHAGHAHVQDQHREFLRHQREQRLIGRFGTHQFVARIVQHRLEHRELMGSSSTIRMLIGSGGPLRLELPASASLVPGELPVAAESVRRLTRLRAHRNSQTRISDSSSSVLTGLAM